MNATLICLPADQIQRHPTDDVCLAYASNLKRNPGNSRLIGSFSLYIPNFDLHLSCTWLRNERGHERIGMPRIKVEAPDGKVHHKTLARWGTARSAERFQRAALQALHQLIANTGGSR